MKKRIDIYGTLEFPLTIGCAAFIKGAEGTRRTSSVKHFILKPRTPTMCCIRLLRLLWQRGFGHEAT